MGTARPTTGSASDQGRRRFNADALAVWAHGGGLGVAVADGIADTAARAAAGGSALDALLAARAAIVASKGDAVLVVAALRAVGGEIAWVGDCRAYFFDGAGVRLLTADQTMAAAVRETGVAAAPRWEHVVTASVRSASAANAGRVRIPEGWGRLALVTDGVHRELSPAEIAAVLAHGHDPATAARELTDLALLAGGGDNASATVVEVPLVPALPAQRTDTSPAFPEVAAEAADTA